MVKVELSNKGFVIYGHAEYDKLGYDIVCSAISALAQTIFLSMRESCNVINASKTRGFMYVEVDESDYSNLLLRTLYLGVREVERAYPSYVRINKIDEVVYNE